MAEETLSSFLQRRERELTWQIAALKGQLEPREMELAQIQQRAEYRGPGETVPCAAAVTARIDLPYAEMTIKQLVLQALHDRYSLGGATSSEIRKFIRGGYGRMIAAASLRPQLHRLKLNKQLRFDDTDGRWKL